MNNIISKIFSSIKKIFKSYENISEETVIEVIDEGKKSGAIDSTEHELIKSILEFTDTLVKEIMIPRSDIVAINITSSRDQIISTFINEGYSRIPVFKDSLNNIIGILYAKDLISIIEHRDLIITQDIIRPIIFVPETKKISILMKELQTKKQHIAIVLNEFGDTEGLITIEDILEEIVGEIRDEYDEEVSMVPKNIDGSSTISGLMRIEEFNLTFTNKIPESRDYATVSGFLHKITGRIPDLQEQIIYSNLTFTIENRSPGRIKTVKVTSK